MKTLFVAAGPESWGSSRMRCYWPAAHMADAQVGTYDYLSKTHDIPYGTDVMIWQKQVNVDLVKAYPHERHYWDVCDPLWWWQPGLAREYAQHMTGIVASSPALAADCAVFLGRDVHCIPDRLELKHFTRQAQHAERTPVRLIWYGVSVNRLALFAALVNLERLAANGHKIELTICDDRPEDVVQWSDMFPVYHTRWTLEGEVDVLTAHDIALLPPYPGPWGRVKSNNKTLTAWACGLPVSSGEWYPSLAVPVTNANERRALGENGRWNVEQYHRVEASARQWEEFLCA